MCGYEEARITEESAKNDGTDLERDAVFAPETIGSVSKSYVELIKHFSDIQKTGNYISVNLTINDIEGDNYSDGAINSSAGHDNIFNEAVRISSNSSASREAAAEQAKLDLSDYNLVYKFLKEEQQNPYCALLIVLSIFDNSQFDLVCDEAKLFYDMLAEEKKITSNTEESAMAPFEISRQEASIMFGITFYQGKLITAGGRFLTSFIGFSSENHSLNILRCIYSEFVTLKDKVTAFLTKLICSEKVTLYVAAINTIKKLCDINPEYFISTIVVRLAKNKSIPSDIAIAQVLCAIAEHAESENRAEKYLDSIPSIDKDIHYYIITLMMCKTLLLKREKIGKLMRPILWELIQQPKLQYMLNKLKLDLPDEENFINNIDLFFNIGERYAEYYIALISEISNILKQMKHNDARRDFVHFIALLFIQEDYRVSRLNTANPAKFKDMIFIRLVLRDNETSNNLVYIWAELLKNRRFKRATENILENYLLLRNDYINDITEYLKVEEFFFRLANEKRIRNNVCFFLLNISTRPQNSISLAGQIYQRIGGKRND